MNGGVARGSRAYPIAAGLLWVTLALVILLNKRGAFTPDIKPEIYLAPGRTAGNLFSSWLDTQQLGFPNFNVGLAPVAAFVGLLRTLGLSAALTVRLLHLLLLILAGWGAARLYAEVAGPGPSRAGRLLAGLVYTANPYTVVAGDTLAITLPYAFLPWQVLFLIRALERPRGWRWPAAFALTFLAMSGMNAGVVPALQLVYLPAVIWYVGTRSAVPPRRMLAALGRCALLTLLVSAYWLVPAIAARGVGGSVLANSESLTGIAGPSSFAEVLRGLGLWVMYGRGPDGPWQPGFTSYLTNPLVITLSFALPALVGLAVLLTRGGLRRLALGMVVVTAVVMVGLFPPDNPSPIGRLLRYGFIHVSALGALRTTNKAGGVLLLGAALLIAGAGATLARRATLGQLASGSAGLAVVLVGATWPAWSGGLFSDQLSIPGYWKQAAHAVDAGSPVERVWLLPGEVRSHYRWSQERVDDIDKSLLSRPSLLQTTVPNPSPVASNFLTAIDTQLQEGSLPAGTLSAAARYMGVSDLLVRNDLVWEETGGARPSVVHDQVTQDPGLLLLAGYGSQGENVGSPVTAPVSAEEAALPPVQHYLVGGSRLMARVEPLRGSLLVSGDGWALAPLESAGLLPLEPSFRYLGDLTPAAFNQALQLGSRVVLTDTNRRRTTALNQLAGSQGPLLPADRDPGPSRTLFGPSAQTVLRVEGGVVSATSAGGVFVAQPDASPENAFDGDPRTAWLFGDFGRAVGQRIELRLPAAREISTVKLTMRPRGTVTIARVRLTVGPVSRTVAVPPSGVADLSIPATRTDRVQLEVTATRGAGINGVGVDEISIPGVQVRRVAALPTRLDALARDLDPAAARALAATPIDVVLSRALGTRSPDDDEETGLDREFTLPQSRTFRVSGVVRPDWLSTDDAIDRLLGVTGDVVATSSSRASDDPAVRAGAAVDGDPFTSWSPAEPALGAWLELTGAPRRVHHIDLEQLTRGATRVLVYLDGRLAADAPVGEGVNRIPVRPQTASRLRLVVAARADAQPVHVSEVGFGSARLTRQPKQALAGCVTVGLLDGKPLRMRPVHPLTSLKPVPFTGCGAPLTLSAGSHQLRAVRSWMPDELVLRDLRGAAPPPKVTTTISSTVQALSTTHWKVSATLPPGPQLLVLGQNYDPRWRATLDGRSVGPTIAADGYSAAWVIDAPGSHTFDIRFAPQRYASIALGASATGLVLCGGLALRREPWARLDPAAAAGPRRQQRRRDSAGWILVAAAAWLLGGLVVGLVAVALAGWHHWRPPPPRRMLQAGVLLLAALPLAFIVGNLPRWGPISPYLVWHNLWPHWLAGCALLLLCVGAWQQDRGEEVRP